MRNCRSSEPGITAWTHEDTLRLCAPRSQELGMIEWSPQKIIADGTDWRYFNELNAN